MPTGVYERTEYHRLSISKSLKGKKKTVATRLKMSKAQIGNKKSFGRHQSLKTREKISLANTGKKRSEDMKIRMSLASKGKRFSVSTEFKKGSTPWNKWKEGLYMIGSKNHSWKGGVTPINRKIRNSVQISIWKTEVFKRDKYTCQHCFAKGVRLNAHHKKEFSRYPELRTSPENGITLCERCHKKLHSDIPKIKKIIFM